MVCCSACASGKTTCSARAAATRPPLIFEGRSGYLTVARKAMLSSFVPLIGQLDVSPAIPMVGANCVTADCVVQTLSLGGHFVLAVDVSNDAEVWYRRVPRITFGTPGKNTLTVTQITTRYVRLRYATLGPATVAYAAGLLRWHRS